jgi:hypothetical protein
MEVTMSHTGAISSNQTDPEDIFHGAQDPREVADPEGPALS